MYINDPYDFDQIAQAGIPQSQMNIPPDMGTTFGYPTAPVGTPMQQTAGQMPGQMMGQMPAQMPGHMMGQMPAQMPAQMPVTGAAPVDFDMLPTTPVMDVEYTQGYLKSQIGARIKVEFLIGTNMLIDREGTLVAVGISYIIIREVDTDDLLLCDIYSIKFVRFYY